MPQKQKLGIEKKVRHCQDLCAKMFAELRLNEVSRQ